MTDIVAFLTARLDEDEALARACLDRPATNGLGDQVDVNAWPPPAINRYGHKPYEPWTRAFVPFTGAWSPARVLTEIAAKRAIVADYQIVLANNAIEKANEGDEVRIAARDLIVKSLRMVLRRLAAPYADHPDYDPAWKIDG